MRHVNKNRFNLQGRLWVTFRTSVRLSQRVPVFLCCLQLPWEICGAIRPFPKALHYLIRISELRDNINVPRFSCLTMNPKTRRILYSACLSLLYWSRQYSSPKRRYTCSRQYGVAKQTRMFFIFTAAWEHISQAENVLPVPWHTGVRRQRPTGTIRVCLRLATDQGCYKTNFNSVDWELTRL
jgi:hypothetical protein